MRELVAGIGAWIFDPRKLFALTAALTAVGVVLGYISFHDSADRELALHRGAPPQVAIQEFTYVRNVGPADEVNVRAEADFGLLQTLTLPGSDPARRAVVVPLYALSDIGAAMTEAPSDERASALTAQVARRTGAPSPEQPMALGYILHQLPPGADAPVDPGTLAAEMFGDGRNGAVVALNGRIAMPGNFGLMAAGAFAALNVELAASPLVVHPFTEGRVAALTAEAPGNLYIVLLLLAAGSGLGAIAISLRGLGQGGDADDQSVLAGAQEDEPETFAAHPKFAPIPSQQEIIEAERRGEDTGPHWAARASASTLRGLWIALLVLVSVVAMGFRWIKNRLSHPEDEVL